MTVIASWDEFHQAAIDLGQEAPKQTRFVTKYRHCDGKLELKVTDDRTCLQYRTDQAVDLKRWERLTRALMQSMSNRVSEPEEPEVAQLAPVTITATTTTATATTKTTKQGGKRKKGR
ncbi:signal recognition particle, SRP9/SRP14 subunit [Syncephalis fuscata]|nr:signal recognition particle, SRP9/SRP14 subunit [Syncephalis fuscata]